MTWGRNVAEIHGSITSSQNVFVSLKLDVAIEAVTLIYQIPASFRLFDETDRMFPLNVENLGLPLTAKVSAQLHSGVLVVEKLTVKAG